MNENKGIDPQKVTSPRNKWKLKEVLIEGKWWSLAIGTWITNDNPNNHVLVMRWNGHEGTKGNPVSNDYPTWFVLPDETYEVLVNKGFLESQNLSKEKIDFVKDFLKNKIK